MNLTEIDDIEWMLQRGWNDLFKLFPSGSVGVFIVNQIWKT